jgi:hypothetical protein
MWCVYNQVQNTQGHGYTAWTGRHRLPPLQQNTTPAVRRHADEKEIASVGGMDRGESLADQQAG